MKELSCQIIKSHGKRIPYPMSPEDDDKLRNYKINQVVRVQVYGVSKPRSVRQMGTYFACCGLVAENTENPRINTKGKVDWACRVHLDFRDEEYIAVSKSGDLQFRYRSISFKNLGHCDACDYFNRALEYLAELMSSEETTVTVEQLIGMAQERMG